MLIGKSSDIKPREITDERLFWGRREWLASVGAGMAGLALPSIACAQAKETDKLTPYDAVTGYNNFYEFGTDKEDPARNAGTLRPRPWNVVVEGEVKRPATYTVDDLFKGMKPEERVYRMRCVEAWSMVVPWLGHPLKDVIARLEPTSKARYIEFTTLLRSNSDAGSAPARSRLALRRGPQDGRGNAPAHDADRRACTGSRCPTRTAPRSGSRSRGSTGSRAASRSSRSDSWKPSP